MKAWQYIGAVGLCAATVLAQRVEFEKVQNFPNLGMMLALPAAAQALPLAMPVARTFLSVGEPLAQEDRFDPYELWYHDQCCGQWRGVADEVLTLGRVTKALPERATQDMTFEQFGRLLVDRAAQINPRQRAHVDQWVANFVAHTVEEPQSLKINRFALSELLYYPCDDPTRLIYAFRPRRIGNSNELGWFCVVYDAPQSADRALLRKRFEEHFIGTLMLPPRSSKTAGVQSSQLQTQTRDERGVAVPHHPLRVMARKSIENYAAWWYAETAGFIIVSDVYTAVGKSVIEELKEQLPLLNAAFKRLLPLLRTEQEVALVRIFQNRADYAEYVGPDYAWSGGGWMAAQRELVLYQHENREEILRVIRHEIFHQYLSQGTYMLGAAPWLNEGHACFFENAIIDVKRQQITLPEDAERVELLLTHMEQIKVVLPALLQVGYQDFYEGSSEWRQLKYAVAWGLVYYLQKGVPLERNTPYQKLLQDYVKALRHTRNQRQATQEAWQALEMEKFVSDFGDFWYSQRARTRALAPLNLQAREVGR